MNDINLREPEKEENIPVRERVREAKKIFTVQIRKNKQSRYITLPKFLVDKYDMDEGDQIELAFLGFDFKMQREEDKKKGKQKITMVN